MEPFYFVDEFGNLYLYDDYAGCVLIKKGYYTNPEVNKVAQPIIEPKPIVPVLKLVCNGCNKELTSGNGDNKCGLVKECGHYLCIKCCNKGFCTVSVCKIKVASQGFSTIKINLV